MFRCQTRCAVTPQSPACPRRPLVLCVGCSDPRSYFGSNPNIYCTTSTFFLCVTTCLSTIRSCTKPGSQTPFSPKGQRPRTGQVRPSPGRSLGPQRSPLQRPTATRTRSPISTAAGGIRPKPDRTPELSDRGCRLMDRSSATYRAGKCFLRDPEPRADRVVSETRHAAR